jgi:hypothetical protein
MLASREFIEHAHLVLRIVSDDSNISDDAIYSPSVVGRISQVQISGIYEGKTRLENTNIDDDIAKIRITHAYSFPE